MIEGFEIETAPLTKQELELVPIFVKGFSDKIGKAKAITGAQIIEIMRAKRMYGKLPAKARITGARIRKIVNYIRLNQLVPNLIASSLGYYIENDPEEIRKYVQGLRDRAAAIKAVADSYMIPKPLHQYTDEQKVHFH